MKRVLGIIIISGSVLAVGCKKEVPPPPPAPPIVEVVPEPFVEAEPEPIVVEDFERVFFGYDSSELNANAKTVLAHNAGLMNKNNGVVIRIQGHADERGTTEYNLHLGQKRAQRVLDYLVNKGVSPKRIELISYGEELPLDRASMEQAFSKNRRAEFQVIGGPADAVRGTTN
jgi:peptidoglycan-associated lipoprotein